MSSGPVRNENSDIALRLVKVLTRKRKPGPSYGRKKQDGDVVVGVVPTHLRHLYNFIGELTNESCVTVVEVEVHDENEQLALTENMQMGACYVIFWEALQEYLDLDKVTSLLVVLDNWNVVVNDESEETDDKTFYVESNLGCRH